MEGNGYIIYDLCLESIVIKINYIILFFKIFYLLGLLVYGSGL